MLADAKIFLKKNNIKTDDVNFLQIKQLCNKHHLKYCYTFTMFHFSQDVSLNDLTLLLNRLTLLKNHLSKIQDVTTYKSYSNLLNDLDELELNVAIKRFLNQLPADLEYSTSNFLNTEDRSVVKFKNAIFAFDKLHNNYQKDFIASVSRLNTAKQLSTTLQAYIKYVTSSKDILTIQNTYKNIYGVKHVFSNEKIFLCEVTEPEAIKKIGTTSWCIARDYGHWKSYVSRPTARQYVLWNAYADITSPDYQIAFTLYGFNIAISGNYTAHNRRNQPINLFDYFQKYKLEELRPILSEKSLDEKVYDVLDYFTAYPKKRPSWFNSRFSACDFYKKSFIDSWTTVANIEKLNKYSTTAYLKMLETSYEASDALVLYYTFQKNDDKFWNMFLQHLDKMLRKINIRDMSHANLVHFFNIIFSRFLTTKHSTTVLYRFDTAINILVHQYPLFFLDFLKEIEIFITLNFEDWVIFKINSNLRNLKGRNDIEEKKRINVIEKLDDLLNTKKSKHFIKYSKELSKFDIIDDAYLIVHELE